MDCEDIKVLLLEYLREELAPARLAAVERHLQHCSACAAAFAEAGENWSRLQLSPGAPSAQMRADFHAMLEREGAAGKAGAGSGTRPEATRKKGFPLVHFTRPAWLVSYSFILMLSGVLLGETLRPAERLIGFDLFGSAQTTELTRERLVQLCSVNAAGLN